MKTILLLFICIFLSACGNDLNKPYSDTTTYGTVSIGADETLQPLADAQKDTFMGLYRYATLHVKYEPEAECFQSLLNDSVKVIMSTRKLNNHEEAVFRKKNLYPVTTRVAVDALALIVNRHNPDSLLKLSQLKGILNGTIQTWKQIDDHSTQGKISFVFDSNGSSTVRYLKDSLVNGNGFSPACFAAKGSSEVISYIENHPEAIGIIGVSWISDSHDPKSVGFRNKIHVMWLASGDQAVWPDDYYQPYQAYIALKQYPLTRDVYMISREGRAGLGTGFTSFVAGEQGQRIVRISGLLPATMPVRLIKN